VDISRHSKDISHRSSQAPNQSCKDKGITIAPTLADFWDDIKVSGLGVPTVERKIVMYNIAAV